MPHTFEELDLTPELAAEFLAQRPEHQRKVSPHHVAKLARAMSNGTFLLTPQPIIIDWNGKLHDGQHRCAAVVSSGVTIPAVIVRGADPATFALIDTGKSRQAAEFIPGRHRQILAGAARMVLSYRHTGGRLKTGKLNVSRSMVGNKEILDELGTDTEYEAAAPQIASIRRLAKIPAGSLLAVHVLGARGADPDKATLWLDGLETGAELPQGDPRLTLRNRFIVDDGKLSHDPVAQWVYIVRAWNAWNADKEIKILRYRRAGRAAESIPPVFGAAELAEAA